MKATALFKLLAVFSFKAVAAHALDAIDLDNSPTPAHALSAAGYQIVPTTFTGPWGPKGENLTLTGTIQEVVEQIKTINPDYDLGLAEHSTTSSGGDPKDGDLTGLQSDIDIVDADCSQGKWASLDRIKQGIVYLRVVPEDHAAMREKTCTRVSCLYNSAIYLCWEPKTARQEYHRTWNYVADYAVAVTDLVCPRLGGRKVRTKGKAWDPQGMAVLVTADRC